MCASIVAHSCSASARRRRGGNASLAGGAHVTVPVDDVLRAWPARAARARRHNQRTLAHISVKISGVNMRKSVLIHAVSIVAGILGAVALLGAWIAGDQGMAFGFSQAHLYQDAINLQIIAVSGGVCAVYRRQLEREG